MSGIPGNVRMKGKFVKIKQLERMLEIANKVSEPLKFRGAYVTKHDIEETLNLYAMIKEARKKLNENQQTIKRRRDVHPVFDEELANNMECYKCKQSLSVVNGQYKLYSGLYVTNCENCSAENKVPVKKYTLRQKRRRFYGDLNLFLNKYVKQPVIEKPEAVFIKEEQPNLLDEPLTSEAKEAELLEIKKEVESGDPSDEFEQMQPGTSCIKIEPQVNLKSEALDIAE